MLNLVSVYKHCTEFDVNRAYEEIIDDPNVPR